MTGGLAAGAWVAAGGAATRAAAPAVTAPLGAATDGVARFAGIVLEFGVARGDGPGAPGWPG